MLKAFCIFLYMVYFGKTKCTFLSDFWSSKVQIGLDGESLGVKVIHWQVLPLGYQPVCPRAQIKLLCDKLELFPSPQSPAKPVWKIFTLIIHSKLGEGKLFETRKCMDRVSSDISGTVFSPNAQFYVYLTFGSPHARFISLFMVFVDRRHPKVKAEHKNWRSV